MIQKYTALNKWQIDEVLKGITEADRGDFASDEEVKRTLEKWTLPRS